MISVLQVRWKITHTFCYWRRVSVKSVVQNVAGILSVRLCPRFHSESMRKGKSSAFHRRQHLTVFVLTMIRTVNNR